MLQMVLIKTALKKCARINPGRGMPLEVNHVAYKIAVPRTKEMIEGDLIERRGGGISRDVSAEATMGAVRVNDHGHGVPAHIALNATFHFPVTRKWRLFVRRDSIDIRRLDDAWAVRAFFTQSVGQIFQKPRRCAGRLLPQSMLHHGFQRGNKVAS